MLMKKIFVTGRIPGEIEEGTNSDRAAVVQGSVSNTASVCSREATRARTYGKRAAVERARASCQPAHAARRTTRTGPRCLVSYQVKRITRRQDSSFR